MRGGFVFVLAGLLFAFVGRLEFVFTEAIELLLFEEPGLPFIPNHLIHAKTPKPITSTAAAITI